MYRDKLHLMKVLMVCLGNICRSPLAEGILQSKLKDSGLTDWEVDSAGTAGWHSGNPPDDRSVAVARKYGIDISHQRSRQFRATDFDRFDLILVMDSSNYTNVKSLATSKTDEDKIRLIMNYISPDQNQNVPDPYYDDNGFEHVYNMLDQACDALLKNIE